MSVIRRTVQVVAVVGTLLIGVLAVALIVSETPWFKDWLRRYVMRESKQYLNGQLTIGGLGGNLFFGINLSDVAIDLSGEPVVAVKSLKVDYNPLDFISQGVVINDVTLVEPRLVLRKTAKGWNLADLVKKQQTEANRQGPGRPIDVESIGIVNGQLTLDQGTSPTTGQGGDAVGTAGRAPATTAVNLPSRLDNLDAKISFKYEPVRYTVTVDHLSFRTEQPSVELRQMQGIISVRDDDLFFDHLKLHTGDSALNINGTVQQYLSTPVLKLDITSERLSLPEIARVVPSLKTLNLHPAFSIKTDGPLNDLGVKANLTSEAGNVDADVRLDAIDPRKRVKGEVKAGRLNLAALTGAPTMKSNISGTAKLDLTVPPEGINGAAGTWQFSGPYVAIAGYEVKNVDAKGRLEGPRITLDGRVQAYGGTATAKGFVVQPARGRPLEFAFDGRAANVNMRSLPASLNAPRLSTDVTANYHVEARGTAVSGRAALDRSIVEGATIQPGTVATFASNGPGTLQYSANGAIEHANLERLGRGLKIAALSSPRYASDVNARFDVRGHGTAVNSMTLDATGQLTNSKLMGGTVPSMAFDAHLAGGALHAKANGELAGFDPAALTGRQDLKGLLGGRVNVDATVPNISGPLDPATITGSAQVQLAPGTVAGISLEQGTVDASMANGIAEVRQLKIVSPDLNVDAHGAVALTETGQSNLAYHVQATDLSQVGRVVNQPLTGGATVDGSLTGNRQALRASGTLAGSNLKYGDNGALGINSTFTVDVPELSFARAKIGADTKATFLTVGGTDIQELTAKATYTAQQIDFDGLVRDKGRELEARGEALLHTDHSEVHLPAFAVRTQGVEWRLAGTDAKVQYGSGRIVLQNIDLRNGNQELAVDGEIGTGAEAKSGDVRVRAAHVDLASLQRLLLSDRGITGELNADAHLTGTTSAPRVDGTVAIDNGGFRTFKFQSFTSKVAYTSTGITVDARLQQTPQNWLTVTGVAPMTLFKSQPGARAEHVAPTAGDEVNLQVKSSPIDLGVIQGFTTAVTNVTGTVQANFAVQGAGSDPHLNGTIEIHNGAFGLPVAGMHYTGLDTTIRLTPDEVTIPKFVVLDNHGDPLTVQGNLAVHERAAGAFNVSITSDDFKLLDNELGKLGIDSNLKIAGELRRPRIEGDVKVASGRVEVDQILAMVANPYPTSEEPAAPLEPGASVAEHQQGATEAAHQALKGTSPNPALQKQAATQNAAKEGQNAQNAAAPAPSIMDALSMNVRVLVPDNLVLRGQDLHPGGPGGMALGNINITVGGDIRAEKKEGDQLRLVGVVNTVRGFYEFQGRRFDLERDGTIRFTGMAEPDPSLDIRATRVISGVEAMVHVTGTAKAPKLDLSSKPPLDEADILSLIVFNRSMNDLNSGERVSLAQRAGAIASGFVAAPLANSIGKALDLDLFEIEPTQDDVTGQMGAGITLGQQVGEHLYVKFHQELGGPQDITQFIVEYEIRNFLRFRGEGSPSNTVQANRVDLRRVERYGADLIFFFSY